MKEKIKKKKAHGPGTTKENLLNAFRENFRKSLVTTQKDFSEFFKCKAEGNKMMGKLLIAKSVVAVV